jgi:hypothetical protein
LLTPEATPSPGRAGPPSIETVEGTPFFLHAVSTPTVIKTSESVSGISDKGSFESNHETTDPTHYPRQMRLFSGSTHSVVQGTLTEPQPAVQERSTQTEIDARVTTRVEHLKASSTRVILHRLTSVLTIILVIQLSFCYYSLIFGPEQPFRLDCGIIWLRKFLPKLPLQYIGFVFMHFILLGIWILRRQWLSSDEAGGGLESTGMLHQGWRC